MAYDDNDLSIIGFVTIIKKNKKKKMKIRTSATEIKLSSKRESGRTLTNSSMWVAYGRKKNINPSHESGPLQTCSGTTLEQGSYPLMNSYITSNMRVFKARGDLFSPIVEDDKFTDLINRRHFSIMNNTPNLTRLSNVHTKYHAWSSEKPGRRPVVHIIPLSNNSDGQKKREKVPAKKRVLSILKRLFL